MKPRSVAVDRCAVFDEGVAPPLPLGEAGFQDSRSRSSATLPAASRSTTAYSPLPDGDAGGDRPSSRIRRQVHQPVADQQTDEPSSFIVAATRFKSFPASGAAIGKAIR